MFLRLLPFFLLLSCSLFETRKVITIRTEEFDYSKDQAMFHAYQKALVLIAEAGCDQDLGRGDVSTKKMGTGFIAEATYKVEEKNCKNVNKCTEDWTKGETRSQAGEWVWFLGKGIAPRVKKADLYAKGQALDYLTQECSILHKSVRFIERCEERIGGSYIVYTRASITHTTVIKLNVSPLPKAIQNSQNI